MYLSWAKPCRALPSLGSAWVGRELLKLGSYSLDTNNTEVKREWSEYDDVVGFSSDYESDFEWVRESVAETESSPNWLVNESGGEGEVNKIGDKAVDEAYSGFSNNNSKDEIGSFSSSDEHQASNFIDITKFGKDFHHTRGSKIVLE